VFTVAMATRYAEEPGGPFRASEWSTGSGRCWRFLVCVTDLADKVDRSRAVRRALLVEGFLIGGEATLGGVLTGSPGCGLSVATGSRARRKQLAALATVGTDR
jgi:hypothetical protein